MAPSSPSKSLPSLPCEDLRSAWPKSWIFIVVAAMLWSASNNAFGVVVPPFLTEHSAPEHRNELFALQFAIQNITNVVAAILGGVVAAIVASWLGFDESGPGVYRVILVIMAILLTAGLLSVRFLSDDRPRIVAGERRPEIDQVFTRLPRRGSGCCVRRLP